MIGFRTRGTKTRALVIVPPFLKYVAGPLLGPALLTAAGREAGHEVQVLDLDIRWIRDQLGWPRKSERGRWVGDHDKPTPELRRLQGRFSAMLLRHLPDTVRAGLDDILHHIDPGTMNFLDLSQEDLSDIVLNMMAAIEKLEAMQVE